MGIVSYCPNGHRTKLKDRYAGIRIRCPECGAKYWVAAAATDHPPEPGPIAPKPESLPPPIAAAPEAAWCIAVPGGEPSPPLPAADMLAWLESGEVTGKELVWRSDWSDWKPIEAVFPDVLGSGS